MHPPRQDDALAQDTDLLADLLAQVLAQVGEAALPQAQAAINAAAVARRAPWTASTPACAAAPDDDLRTALGALGGAMGESCVQAMAQGFANVNLAERVHRIRRRRASWALGAAPQAGSLTQVFTACAQAHVPASALIEALGRVQLKPVFTAHPTEATRRTLLRKQQRMAAALLQMNANLGALDNEACRRVLRHELTAAWQTDNLAQAPSVADEVEHVTFYLTEVIYPIVPALFEGVQQALSTAYGPACAKAYGELSQEQGPNVRFGTWVGGDMDGNPGVGAATVAATLATQRRAVLAAYGKDVTSLIDRLSQSTSRTQVSTELTARIDAARDAAPNVSVPSRHSEMPYRVLLHHIAARLQATAAAGNAQGAYFGPEELAQDLSVMARSLDAHGGADAGGDAVRRLLRRVHAFGLHLAALDVRQDSQVHREAVAQLLDRPELPQMAAGLRTEVMADALAQAQAQTPPWAGRPMPKDESTALGRMLAVFAAIGTAQGTLGPQSIGLYIISMAHDVDDVLAVLLLAHAAGIAVPDGQGRLGVPLDIAPLFETVPDLSHAPQVLGTLAAHPLIVEHLAQRRRTQHVMLGYSDSNKESGFVASRWALIGAQAALAEVATANGLNLKLFHGRGGTASRGGSKPRSSILADVDSSAYLRMTEQGEIIDGKYGLPDVALRTLELMGGALIERQVRAPAASVPAHFAQAMATCAEASRRAYRGLVADTADFFAYFNAATPIDVIARLRIGSRPASRRTHTGLGDLRAIPWVFAWAQNRQMLPGWYGLGQGLRAAQDAHGAKTLAEMYRAWPFFKNLIDDAAMGLAKTDLDTGGRYAALAGDTGAPIWTEIEARYHEAVAQVLQVTQAPTLLHHDPVLAAAIAWRNPLGDPMSLMQLDYLAQWRAGGRQDEALLRLLMLTVKGIARGLHSTG